MRERLGRAKEGLFRSLLRWREVLIGKAYEGG